jgi:hypothetical protein
LLQQYADARIAEGAAHWSVNARRHEVTKAVLLNSADKLQDTGDGRLLGMEKAILRSDGSTWLNSTAASASRTIPLDNEIGTGQLNAYRALAQFAAGESAAGVVPAIGWDYGTTNGPNEVSKYIFDKPLIAQSYLSVSLAWDRLVDLSDANTNGLYDVGENFMSRSMSNLDLFLLPKGTTDVGQALWSSESTLYNVEHMFFKVPTAGEYEFWVRQNGVSPHADGRQPYAVAWQALAATNWNADADGNWSAAANWTGGVPNAAGAVAIFGDSVTQPRTIAVDTPVTVGRINFESASAYTIAGTNAIIFDLAVGEAHINVANGSHSISAPVTLADPTIMNVAAASNLSITGALNASGVRVTKTGAGVLSVDHVRAAALSVNGGTVAIAPSGADAGTSLVGALSIADSVARLDLNNNAMIINYTGLSPLASIRRQVLAGRRGTGLGGEWNGPGITSSTAATANQVARDSRSVGYAENSTLPLGPYTAFHGASVDDTSVLIAYTRTGDANLDGVVNDDDVTIVGATYAPGVSQPAWVLGDFDYNGFVDDDDVTLLGAFYDPAAPLNSQAAPRDGAELRLSGSAAPIPEPGSLVLFTFACVTLVCLLRRSRGRAEIYH